MSIFGSILSKLGFGKKASADDQTPAATTSQDQAPGEAPPGFNFVSKWKKRPTQEQAPGEAPPGSPPAAINEVDVVAQLESKAKAHPEKLNWKVSIVDLMKLLELDSSLSSRKELAAELGCPPEKMDDSAQMNMWLHKTVMKKLAENGGNIPAELLN